MEFDKSKVYSAVNADELHEGDKVIVAYSLSYLKHCVECDECMDEIVSILSDDNQNRFLISGSRTFALAYLVERAETPELTSLGNGQYIERKHYRPFYNTDELIEEWDKNKIKRNLHRTIALPFPGGAFFIEDFGIFKLLTIENFGKKNSHSLVRFTRKTYLCKQNSL